MGTEVRFNAAQEQYEIVLDGVPVGLTVAQERDGVVVMPHTEIDPAHGGKGLSGQLVRSALDDLRARGKQIRPLCPFVVAYIDKHPQYADLVA